MPLTPPRLDDRTFEQLVTEIRRRIPSFTPEWTDLNESDPGITLAQLFAFLSEHLLFQIDQVPDKGLVTFLKMVGAELHPAVPATADVTLSGLPPRAADPLLIDIDAGTVIETASPPPGERTPVRFETARAFAYLRGVLEDVITIDCDGRTIVHTPVNDAGNASYAPLGAARSTHDELLLAFGLDSPGDWPAGTFRLRVDVAGSDEVGEPPVDPADPESTRRLVWSYASGVRDLPGGGRELLFTDFLPALDSTRDLTRSGYLELRLDGPVRPIVAPEGVETFAGRFVIRACPASADAFGTDAPALRAIRLNTVPARHLTTVTDETVGSSTGLPFQRFRLAHAPVFPGSVELSVRVPGGTAESWTEVDDLFTAGPRDRVFQLLPATGEILFGNGRFGRVPPPDDGSEERGNIVAQRYQWGGGRRGNVGAGSLTQVLSPAGSLDATNLLPARYGDDEESVDEGVTRAPAVVRSRYRAVAASDFEALARETPDVRVARAHALGSTRPGLVPGSTPGSVTLILVPHAAFAETRRAPIGLAPAIARSVLRYLDARRLVTTQLFVEGARFRRIEVDARLRLDRGAPLLATRTTAIAALERYFHPLEGGDEGTGWPLGGTIFHSRVSETLLDVAGVARVDRLRLRLDGSEWIECADVPIGCADLLFSGDHVVHAEGGR